MEKFIRKMGVDGVLTAHMQPIISLAQAIDNYTDDYDSTSSADNDEWRVQVANLPEGLPIICKHERPPDTPNSPPQETSNTSIKDDMWLKDITTSAIKTLQAQDAQQMQYLQPTTPPTLPTLPPRIPPISIPTPKMATTRGNHLPQTQQHTSSFGIHTEQFQSDMGIISRKQVSTPGPSTIDTICTYTQMAINTPSSCTNPRKWQKYYVRERPQTHHLYSKITESTNRNNNICHHSETCPPPPTAYPDDVSRSAQCRCPTPMEHQRRNWDTTACPRHIYSHHVRTYSKPQIP